MKRLNKFFNQKLRKINKNSAFDNIISSSNPNLQYYKKCWNVTHSIYNDIKLNQFPNVAVVGPCSHFLIQELFQRRAPKQLTICDQSESSLEYTISCLKQRGMMKMLQLNDVSIKTKVIEDDWPFEQESLSLVVSCMHLHQVNNIEGVLGAILQSLHADGCLIATTLGPDNLEELRISMILAQNQRYGGVSPHVSPFISMSDMGNLLHRCGYRITTLSRTKNQQKLSDPLQLMNYIKYLGQNSSLIGKRKGCFKDIFYAMVAIYSRMFDREEGINVTNDTISFIGWKYSDTQIKPAKRGSQNITFQQWVKQLQKIEGNKIKFGSFDQQGQKEDKNKNK